MNKHKNIGLIVCGHISAPFQLSPASTEHGYALKKVLLTGKASGLDGQNFPGAEIVNDKALLLQDESLDLIIVSAASNHCTDLIGEALQTGKPVRVL